MAEVIFYGIIFGIVGIFLGIVIDYLLFRAWHHKAHSNYLKELEKERKREERHQMYEERRKLMEERRSKENESSKI